MNWPNMQPVQQAYTSQLNDMSKNIQSVLYTPDIEYSCKLAISISVLISFKPMNNWIVAGARWFFESA